jgi:hypothetical protein
MTNFEMLQFQSNNLVTIIAKLETNVDDREVLLNSKVDVNIKMNTFKITNLTVEWLHMQISKLRLINC